jgi:hypothetical protein
MPLPNFGLCLILATLISNLDTALVASGRVNALKFFIIKNDGKSVQNLIHEKLKSFASKQM